jgi:hypothetical protein
MKRLIDGVSYNTDTATLLARSDYEGDWNNNTCPVEGELFQTRGGAFFIVEKIAIGETDPGHSGSETITKTRFSKCVKRLLDIGSPLAKLKSFSTPSKTK